MREFLIRSSGFILLFALFFFILNAIFLGLIAYTDWDFKKRMESLNFEKPDFDLLVFGNSLALDGIDTEFLTKNGIRSYNLSIGGSSVRTSYIQLCEYLAKYEKKPKYVLYGSGSYLGDLKEEEIHPIVEFTMDNYKFRINDIPIIKFKWLGLELLKKVISSEHRSAELSYGQLKFKKKTPDSTILKDLLLNKDYYQDSEYLSEIAELCSQNGIEFIVIEMPGFKNTRNSNDTGPFILDFKNGHSAWMFNLNSRDFCKIFDSKEDWIANSHLNEYGARKFTNELVIIIDELNAFQVKKKGI